jgi:hypothetical protein
VPTLLRPLWLTGHVLVAAGAVVMVKLGLWQWDRARDLSSIQNYSYAVEWGVFALLTVLGWAKICHDELIPDPNAGVLFGAVEPAVSSAEMAAWDTDPEVAAWNAQFRALHLRHALKEAGLSEADVARQLAEPDRLPDPDRKALQ